MTNNENARFKDIEERLWKLERKVESQASEIVGLKKVLVAPGKSGSRKIEDLLCPALEMNGELVREIGIALTKRITALEQDAFLKNPHAVRNVIESVEEYGRGVSRYMQAQIARITVFTELAAMRRACPDKLGDIDAWEVFRTFDEPNDFWIKLANVPIEKAIEQLKIAIDDYRDFDSNKWAAISSQSPSDGDDGQDDDDSEETPE